MRRISENLQNGTVNGAEEGRRCRKRSLDLIYMRLLYLKLGVHIIHSIIVDLHFRVYLLSIQYFNPLSSSGRVWRLCLGTKGNQWECGKIICAQLIEVYSIHQFSIG